MFIILFHEPRTLNTLHTAINSDVFSLDHRLSCWTRCVCECGVCVKGYDGQVESGRGQSRWSWAQNLCTTYWHQGRLLLKARQLPWTTRAPPIHAVISSSQYFFSLCAPNSLPEFVFNAESSELWRSVASSTRFERFAA